ncbi:MAG: hypothetical protein ABSH25_06455 [Syntrophorhabdales bacterium]
MTEITITSAVGACGAAPWMARVLRDSKVSLTPEFQGQGKLVRFVVREPGIYRYSGIVNPKRPRDPESGHWFVWPDRTVEDLSEGTVRWLIESGDPVTVRPEDTLQELHRSVSEAAAALGLIYAVQGIFRKKDLTGSEGRCCHALHHGPLMPDPGTRRVWRSPGWVGSIGCYGLDRYRDLRLVLAHLDDEIKARMTA